MQVRQGIPPIDGGVPVPIEDYQYDQEGNRTFSNSSSGYESNAHNQLLEDDTYRYAYDLRGNRISRTHKITDVVETYAYDSQNRLTGYASGPSFVTYAYDALDRRIARTALGDVEAFVYDPWNPYATTANDAVLDFENGTLAKRWLHGPQVDEPLAFEGYTGTTNAGSGSAYGLFANRLGSILTAVSLSTGAVAADYDYDAFGTQTQTVSTIEQRYGYTGREHDLETGLIYYRARHYDPATGQFIQRDPIGFAAGDLNLYAYTFNDPYNWTDPSGLAATADYVRNMARNARTATGVVGNVAGGIASLAANIRNALAAASLIGIVANEGGDSGDSSSPKNNTNTDAAAAAGGAAPPPEGGDDNEGGANNFKKPSTNLEKGDKVDINRFSQKVRGTSDFKDPKSGWTISKDTAGHGGRAWKLLDKKGVRK
ncbi:RHS repeat-associated core domain-containing protein [Ruegeria halocynthiae]|uniref:RHS repeat-associated core domain-containing protein n=1 Tax=Ruegeria halocynthiae TaxID=985054 RepID=UPI000569BB46|nr:RHS repeat-associated core domain-containing protein [Ruegeria halocynthiae]